MKRAVFTILLALTSLATSAAADSDKLWWGGGVGASFGDVDYVTIEPHLGYSATDDLSFGLGLVYRFRDDDRFSPGISTQDYGGSLFARYRIAPYAFLQAEYEHLSYEFVDFGGLTERDDYDSVLAGAGFSRPLGRGTVFYATALYNFSYDDDEFSPYDDPVVYRAGISVGF